MSRQFTRGVLRRRKADVWLYKGEVWEYEEVTNPITGRTWMDRNLGASRAALSLTDTEAHGDLFQWGRLDDLHQNRDSETTNVLSDNIIPNNGGKFILGDAETGRNWLSSNNRDLWSNGLNVPAPDGWRVPNDNEWLAEIATWQTQDRDGAFNSVLKLSLAGIRFFESGNISDAVMFYWSMDSTFSNARIINITISSVGGSFRYRADGIPLRLIKEQ